MSPRSAIDRNKRRRAGARAALLSLAATAMAPAGAKGEERPFLVYEAPGDVQDGVAHLDRLPKAPPALRGLVAMYAFQAAGACDHHDAQGLRCTLTTALGLGPQCSRAHRSLVKATFPGGIPVMDVSTRGPAGKPVAACYLAPDSANVQLVWTSIRLAVAGDKVHVLATAARLDHADCGFAVRFDSVYRVRGKVAEQVSNHVTPGDWTRQCPGSQAGVTQPAGAP